MGLVKVGMRDGHPAYVDPARVVSLCASKNYPGGPLRTIINMDGESGFDVDATPDEVHAALFPEDGWARADQALGVVDMAEPAKEFRSELAEALDPATYAEEWATYSPEKVRAMAWALGLVRARLGVGE